MQDTAKCDSVQAARTRTSHARTRIGRPLLTYAVREGVDGSSPSEGFKKPLQTSAF
jgi:hypothetical protein